MIYKIIISFCLALPAFSSFAQNKKPVPIIFDSDMGPDYDDVGAITLLHAFADSGQATILATIASTKYEGVAAVFNVFNTYFKRPGTLIGVPKGKALELKDWQHWTDTIIHNYPHTIKQNSDVPDAVEVYRKVLAAQPDKSVTIVTVGFLTNLSALLQSQPDSWSKLNGKELVQKKVKHLVSMAGKFPAGGEFNVDRDPAASQYTVSNWPTPIFFSGFEIGAKIKSGLPLIHNATIRNSPVKDVFRICISKDKNDSAGRMSWDETAVLVAVKGYEPWYTIKKGRIVVAADGTNKWIDDSSQHSYLIEAKPASVVEEVINKLIMHQPVVR